MGRELVSNAFEEFKRFKNKTKAFDGKGIKSVCSCYYWSKYDRAVKLPLSFDPITSSQGMWSEKHFKNVFKN